MNLLLPAPPHSGPSIEYLVDLGRLVPVAAVNARSAYQIALTSVGLEPEFPAQTPLVYQLDSDGELIAVYD
jgi:hypothetical protein